jgi:hypothetical protein
MESCALFVLLEVGVIQLSYFMTPNVEGSTFLLYYFFLWFFLLLVTYLNKWTPVSPMIIYFSAGISGFFAGQESSMLLWSMIIGGPFLYFALVVIVQIGGGDWFGCGGGGGCSAGSGGGCGGGCGGG